MSFCHVDILSAWHECFILDETHSPALSQSCIDEHIFVVLLHVILPLFHKKNLLLMVKLLFWKFIAQVTFDFVAKKNKLCFNFHYSSHYNPLLLLLLKGGERERGRGRARKRGWGKKDGRLRTCTWDGGRREHHCLLWGYYFTSVHQCASSYCILCDGDFLWVGELSECSKTFLVTKRRRRCKVRNFSYVIQSLILIPSVFSVAAVFLMLLSHSGVFLPQFFVITVLCTVLRL